MASNSKPGLFERIFKYPASSNRPTENLATEITAFFLDRYPPLLKGFLKAIDDQLKETKKTAFSKAEGLWKIDTQKRLHADQDYGVADLVLSAANPSSKIVVEVKIDAQPSHDGQTALYEKHLADLGEVQAALALLTRWKPPTTLAGPCNAQFRFKDFARLIREALPSDEADERAIGFFALSWAEYLEKEWCIPDLTHAHIASLASTPTPGDIDTIEKYLEQMLDSTVDALTNCDWRRQTISKSKHRSGRYQVWGRLLNRDGDGLQDFIQLGCDFGAESNRPVMRGLVYLHGKYTEASSQFQLSDDILNPRDKSGHVAMLSDILKQGIPASNPGEPIEDTKLAGQIQEDLEKAVRKLEAP
ncbi:MAG TPA: hypothetical protein VFW87_06580 [Pirellulales bacterium]|nr:hypothetical protein [Pirellulales bacterium]